MEMIGKGEIDMTNFGPDVAGLFIVLMLILTLVSLLAITFWYFSPGHFKPADKDRHKLVIEV